MIVIRRRISIKLPPEADEIIGLTLSPPSVSNAEKIMSIESEHDLEIKSVIILLEATQDKIAFRRVLDRPIWSYTVEYYLKFKPSKAFEIYKIILIIPTDRDNETASDVARFHPHLGYAIDIIAGDSTYHRSLFNGVQFVTKLYDRDNKYSTV